MCVRAHYAHSPPVARFIGKHFMIRTAVRIVLVPLLGVSYMMLHLGPAVTATILLLLFVVLISLLHMFRKKRVLS
jgi:hypothetical protein